MALSDLPYLRLRELRVVKGTGWFAWSHGMPNWNFIEEAVLEWESRKVALKEKYRQSSASCSMSRSVLSSEFDWNLRMGGV